MTDPDSEPIVPYEAFMPYMNDDAYRRRHYRKYVLALSADALSVRPVCEQAIHAADEAWGRICDAADAPLSKGILAAYVVQNRTTLHDPEKHAVFWAAVFSLSDAAALDISAESLRSSVETAFGTTGHWLQRPPNRVEHVCLLAQLVRIKKGSISCPDLPAEMSGYDAKEEAIMRRARELLGNTRSRESAGGAVRTATMTGLAVGALLTAAGAFLSGPK